MNLQFGLTTFTAPNKPAYKEPFAVALQRSQARIIEKNLAATATLMETDDQLCLSFDGKGNNDHEYQAFTPAEAVLMNRCEMLPGVVAASNTDPMIQIASEEKRNNWTSSPF